MLKSTLKNQEYFAAGVPWFVTLFGRDSLIAALEALAFDPNVAAQTLHVLASYQGTKSITGGMRSRGRSCTNSASEKWPIGMRCRRPRTTAVSMRRYCF
jgi:glycogen debranching enzyme